MKMDIIGEHTRQARENGYHWKNAMWWKYEMDIIGGKY
jgi:hypothetical protein